MADEKSDGVIDVVTGVGDVAGTVFEIFSGLNSREKCLIEVTNSTGALLRRISDNHPSGGFATLPEDEIPPGGTDAYIAHDTGLFRGAVGEVTYEVIPDGAQAAQGTWTIRWSIPQVGSTSCGNEIKGGLDRNAFKGSSRIGSGSETEAKFELKGPGAGKGTDKDRNKTTGPELKSTVLIEVRNHTDQPLARGARAPPPHDHGGFVTRPVEVLAPGAVDSFASFETDRSDKQGSEGFLTYTVGDTGTRWTIRWHNPENADNTSDSVLDGPQADQFTGLDQIGAGEENVPAVFTLSGAGGGGGGRKPPPKPGTGNAVGITVVNETGEVLTLLDSAPFTGEFVTDPPARLAAGETGTFACAESEGQEQTGCQGFARYQTPDVGECLWTLVWNNPESGENTTETNVAGTGSARFTPQAQIDQDKAAASAVFTLSGEPSTPVEPEFAPPVERDEPTLRLGDNSVDGWVEYLQVLLNGLGYGPLPEDGDFNHAVLAEVRRFQANARDQAGGKLQVDGVVGNQTWAALREEDPRPPSTDDRQPHTYVEEGPEARFYTEDNAVVYFQTDDTLMLFAVNTGNEPIHPGQFEANARITFPDGVEQHTFAVELPDSAGVTQPGEVFIFQCVLAEALHRQHLDPGSYRLEAYLPDALGGDQTEETLQIQ